MLGTPDNPENFDADREEILDLSENLQVIYDASNGVMHVKWNGKVSSREFKDGYFQLLRIVRIYKPFKWILDLQNREVIGKEDKLWVFKNIFPEILRLLQRDVFMAVILPVYFYESLIDDFDGDDLIDNNNLLIIQHFLYYEESLRWLNDLELTNATA
ncbi:hypothetical protein WG947_00540 [Pontibacter sp. H259]|uniref:hypothetical protein n=1 Tax=Pontibacter sp. H259 TaxID=3133421 RepID=UPI0030BB96F2